MRLKIENYRGIKNADIDVSRIALICGKNATGKSAIAQSAIAALTGNPMPITGVLKTMAGLFVKSGAASGSVSLESPEGTARVEWPRAVYKTTGTPPVISEIAAGKISLADLEPTKRSEALIAILNALPTFKDLENRLSAEDVSPESITHIWEFINAQGWDAAHTHAKEQGAKLKGAWEATTGERWGLKKAESFVPKNWEPDLAGMSLDSLQALVTDCRASLDAEIAVNAVDQAEYDRIKAIADQLPDRQKEAETLLQISATKRLAYESLNNELSGLKAPGVIEKTTPCPHCGSHVVVRNNAIYLPTDSAPNQVEIDEYNNKKLAVAKALSDYKQADNELRRVEVLVDQSKTEQAKLANINVSDGDKAIDQARNLLSVAEQRLNAFQTKTKADRAYKSVIQNEIIVSVLAPSGLRQEVLTRDARRFFSDYVNKFAEIAKWQNLDIDGDMTIRYGDRVYNLLSESEKFRVRALIQIAVANYEKAVAVVVDAADILDKEGRNGLLKILPSHAVVCMTMNNQDEVPDLSRLNLGLSYWIENGETKQLGV